MRLLKELKLSSKLKLALNQFRKLPKMATGGKVVKRFNLHKSSLPAAWIPN